MLVAFFSTSSDVDKSSEKNSLLACGFTVIEVNETPFGTSYNVVNYTTTLYDSGSEGCANWTNTMFDLWLTINFR